jgi:hypothetical protein
MRTASVVCGLLVLAGCGDGGPKRLPVSGTVSFDGTPIAKGEILFTAPGQAPDAAPIVDGKFTAQVQPGKKRVEIRASKQVGESDMGPIMEGYIPARYNESSELEADITAARQDLEFKLTSNK